MEMHPLFPADEHSHYFKMFVKSLIQKFQPLQIFCFAKKSFLEQTDGCFLDQVNDHTCNYSLLIVTETTTRIDHEIQEFSNVHYKQGIITILCHRIETIQEAIRANNRFFITVYNDGHLLYTLDGLTQPDFPVRFIPTQSGIKAKKQLHHRMPLVEGFLTGAHQCLVNQQYNVCTFMLHQAVEQACIILIRVHMAYRSEIHNLKRLLNLCSCFSNKPFKVLLSRSSEDERLFDILIKSYSEARYGDHFSVEFEDAQQLYDRITAFTELVKKMCEEKIQMLENDAILHKRRSQEREVING
ncbi:HEPN domain-containing protein [Pedobacter cryoconitis]|uniref:HEPN domain-containing protein n=1 Tax=Pedobacter cryoconitis TaxID=188932 RepID=A0A7W8YX72_9SPHI|nr:HEPN domain-containing protein [Pedobacter cryoconitis]MBB5623203.1 HEPN domain-containing protein [Pedobacter cryoconitis]